MACKQLGLGLTVFKRRCRTHQVTRWPFRKTQRLFLALQRLKVVVLLSFRLCHNQQPQANKEQLPQERASLELVLQELLAGQPQSSWHIQMCWLLQLAADQPHEVLMTYVFMC